MPVNPTPYPLDGRLERAALSPLLSAFLGLILAFVLFQAISTVAVLVLLLAKGVTLGDLMVAISEPGGLAAYADDLIIGNTIGQIFGLLIPAILFARLHSSRWPAFLRLNAGDARTVILSVVGLFALIPLVQYLGVWSDSLPWPDSIRLFEKQQMDLIESVLMQDFSLVFTISMLALTPAICEEVLFRGYVQRQAERSMGIWAGIAFSGIIFGLYHLRLTQALPLSLLGIYLAYITWRSGSLLPAILVHLANNSLAAVLGKMASTGAIDVDLETFELPLSIFLPSVVVLAGILWLLHKSRPVSVTPDTEEARDGYATEGQDH